MSAPPPSLPSTAGIGPDPEALSTADAERKAEIGQEAQHWFLALLDRPTAAKRAAALAWRQADPAHEDAWLRFEAGWQAAASPASRLARDEAGELAQYLQAMDDRKATRKWTAVAIAGLLALGLSGALWLERPHLLQDLAADHVTGRGERRSVTLADGTTVLLDADSALDVDYSPGLRHVTLLRGAGFFDVTHSDVPFVVAAAGGEVRVMGTGFDLRLLEKGAAVTLDHGRVAVRSAEGAQVILQPGETTRFDAAAVEPAKAVDLQDSLAWRGGRYVFYQARLADVVDEIARYRPGRIVLTSAALAEEKVTGSFTLADPDAALASLQASVGFRMDVLAGRLVVISK